MSTFTISIEVPEELKKLGFTPETLRHEIPILLVLKRFREGAISSGKGAELLGINRRQFIDLLAREKIPFFDSSEDELAEELRTIRSLGS